MTAASELNSSLNSQCMDFCQALARQGLEFKFSVTIGSAFTFSLLQGYTTSHHPQEEEQPFYTAEKCEAQGGISEEEISI